MGDLLSMLRKKRDFGDLEFQDDVCPRCSMEVFMTGSVKLLRASSCGHTLCEKCRDELFEKDATVPCPTCREQLRKLDFSEIGIKSIQEHLKKVVVKESDVRRQVMEKYNCGPDAFATLEEYNDFLERRESIVFGLLYGSKDDVEKLKKEMAEFERQNREMIARSSAEQKRLLQEEFLTHSLEQARSEMIRKKIQESHIDIEKAEFGLQREYTEGLSKGRSADAAKKKFLKRLDKKKKEINSKLQVELEALARNTAPGALPSVAPLATPASTATTTSATSLNQPRPAYTPQVTPVAMAQSAVANLFFGTTSISQVESSANIILAPLPPFRSALERYSGCSAAAAAGGYSHRLVASRAEQEYLATLLFHQAT
eukprot:c9588_g1_i1.p1 GENE.c9588_g1_i1~~c9588_g1_i1.p1  ORF type:complete len:371 (-),score=79.49 c9588_g1_i1:1265-2377(-)